VLAPVPVRAFKEEPTDQSAISRLLNFQPSFSRCWHVEDFSFVVSWVVRVRKDEFKFQKINFNPIFAREVLQNGSQE